MKQSIVFFDTEISVQDKRIHDIGAVKENAVFLFLSVKDFCDFFQDADFLCGHNIIHHDLTYLSENKDFSINFTAIDTLYLSPLMFPMRPYHALLKDDKLQSDEMNNPVNDSIKAKDLFYDECDAFLSLNNNFKKILCGLLYKHEEFKGFFDYMDFKPENEDLSDIIKKDFKGRI